MTSSFKTSGPWINTYNSKANQKITYPMNIDLIDVDATGENLLVMGEFNQILTFFKGENLDWQHRLIGVPSAVSHFHMKDLSGRTIPIVCVAAEKFLYMFKLRKKYMKLVIDYDQMSSDEFALWRGYNGDAEGMNTFLMGLNELKNSGIKLSYQSLNILMLETLHEQLQFFEDSRDTPNYAHDNATCMTSVAIDYQGVGAPSRLVLGTENKKLKFLDEPGDDFEQEFELPETPFQMIATGCLSKDFSIYIAARNNKLIHFKNWVVQNVKNLEGPPITIKKIEDLIFVAFAEGMITAYTEGSLNIVKTILMPAEIGAFETLYFEKLGACKGFVVGLKNKQLRMYGPKGNTLLNTIVLDDEPTVLKFGKIGRENGCLVVMFKNIGIQIKILKRNFLATKIDNVKDQEEVPAIKPPARSKLFIEQLNKDKEMSAEIYYTYQKDVLKLKNFVDERYLKLLDTGMISASSTKSVKIHASVEGLGPKFLIHLTLTNESQRSMLGLKLALRFDTNVYRLDKSAPAVGCLLPFKNFEMTIEIINISDVGANGNVKVFLFKPTDPKPLSGAVITMPLSDVPDL